MWYDFTYACIQTRFTYTSTSTTNTGSAGKQTHSSCESWRIKVQSAKEPFGAQVTMFLRLQRSKPETIAPEISFTLKKRPFIYGCLQDIVAYRCIESIDVYSTYIELRAQKEKGKTINEDSRSWRSQCKTNENNPFPRMLPSGNFT